MKEYISLIAMLFIMLVVTKIMMVELSVRALEKRNQASGFYLQFDGKFVYRKPAHLVFMCVFVYLYSSSAEFFSALWFVELLGFVAVTTIAEGLSQYVNHHYCQMRFKAKYTELHRMVEEIKMQVDMANPTIEYDRSVSYSTQNILNQYVNVDTHLAFLSNDHGQSVNRFNDLPPITYVVDTDKMTTEQNLENKDLKVTTLTAQGSLPFKDEKLDVVYTCDVNYDKFELYRIMKPGAHVMISQLGNDNFNEVLRWMMPVSMKGNWDRQECSRTLAEIGFEIVDSYEDRRVLRFTTFKEVVEFVNTLLGVKVEMKAGHINFYTHVMNEIKNKGFYEVSRHHFFVIAKKVEIIS